MLNIKFELSITRRRVKNCYDAILYVPHSKQSKAVNGRRNAPPNFFILPSLPPLAGVGAALAFPVPAIS